MLVARNCHSRNAHVAVSKAILKIEKSSKCKHILSSHQPNQQGELGQSTGDPQKQSWACKPVGHGR